MLDAVIVAVPIVVISVLVTVSQRNDTIEGATGTHVDLAGQVIIIVTALLITLGYPYLLLRHNGQTVGMMAVGVRAVDRDSGARLTSGQAGRRVLAFFLIVSLWAQLGVLIGFHHVYGPVPAVESIFRLLSFAALITTALWPLGNPVNQTLQGQGRWNRGGPRPRPGLRPPDLPPPVEFSWPGSPSSCCSRGCAAGA